VQRDRLAVLCWQLPADALQSATDADGERCDRRAEEREANQANHWDLFYTMLIV